jgi:hypothetical protein
MKKRSPSGHGFKNQGNPGRPFSATILIVVVLIFTSLNALRMITALRTWDFLREQSLNVPVVYLVISGAVWLGVGIFLLYSLWTRRKWSPPMAVFWVLTYSCYYWLDRLLIADPSAVESRWIFAIGFNLLIIIIAIWTLKSPRSRDFFSG